MKKALTIRISEHVLDELRSLVYMCPSLSMNDFCEYAIEKELKSCLLESGFTIEYANEGTKLKRGRKITLK